MDSSQEDDLNPVSLIVVSKETKEDKLLFMYPYDKPDSDARKDLAQLRDGAVLPNIYCVKYEEGPVCDTNSLLVNGHLTGLSDDIMGYLFSVKPELCNERFELKINDVRFVGFPMALNRAVNQSAVEDDDTPTILLFNVIFVLRASASKAVVTAYQELSKRIASALVHEELRCQYLSSQAKIMNDCHEEVLSMPEALCHFDSPYRLMLETSELAQHLQNIFTDVTEVGACSLHINGWVEISFCLPQKVYSRLGIPPITFENLESTLSNLRPFHSMLLLEDPQDIIASLPVDSSPALCRLLRNQSSMSSLQTISVDIDLPLSQVCMLVRHLVCWGKAIVIFPVCENNVYMVSPCARIGNHALAENFAETFAGKNLMSFLAELYPPISLAEFLNPLNHDLKDQTERIEIILWLLQRRLIMQLHTYVYMSLPHQSNPPDSKALACLPEEKLIEIRKEFPDENAFETALTCAAENTDNDKQIEDDLRLFASLIPYFNGKHHLEDMMYCLNCKRTELFRVLDRFRSLLVTAFRHDSLAAGFEN